MLRSTYFAGVFTVGLMMLPFSVHAQTADDAVGKWADAETGGQVEFYKCANALCGKITKVVDNDSKLHMPNRKDSNNPDPSQRNKLLEGSMIMEGATRIASKPAWKGKLYSPGKGKRYQGTITMVDKNTLTMKGCIIWPICSTSKWVRVTP